MDGIELDKTFQLFHGRHENTLTLCIDTLALPMVMGAVPSTAPKRMVLTPFRPELGYVIDSRDFALATREAKIQAEYDQTPDGIFHPEAPLALCIYVFNVPLMYQDKLVFPKESKFRDLLFLLSTPSMQLAARPTIWQPSGRGQVDFSSFFPTDIGEDLPVTSAQRYTGNTFHVFLPNDLEKLTQLRGRFLALTRSN